MRSSKVASISARQLRLARRRAAFTLIEMLVAMACTLVLMGAVVNLFSQVGDSVSDSRALIDLSERLRQARNRLQGDLAGATATMIPPLRPELDMGYLEYREGLNSDSGKTFVHNDLSASDPGFELTGDADDVLALTTHSRTSPFVGRFPLFNPVSGATNATTIESNTAEVIWYTVEQPQRVPGIGPKLYTLYRRMLLVAPRAEANLSNADRLLNNTILFNHICDVSARIDSGQIMLNTLGALTKRENRWWHFPLGSPGFPYPLPSPMSPYGGEDAWLKKRTVAGHGELDRLGEDVVLTNVLAFDVKAYDPYAPLKTNSNGTAMLVPSDYGYSAGINANPEILGAFVDLNYGCAPGSIAPLFSAPGATYHTKSKLTLPTYDTWSLHAENNGIDEDGDGVADGGFNGLDDNNNNLVDELAERDTLPMYPAPLRGIQVKIRAYEPDSRQVREVTIVEDFLPE